MSRNEFYIVPSTGRASRRVLWRNLVRWLVVVLFAAVVLCLGIERMYRLVLFNEDISDIQFAPWTYIDRTCECLSIDAKPMSNGAVAIRNTCPKALHAVRGKVKYFGWRANGNKGIWTFSFSIGDLEAGQEVVFMPLSRETVNNDGMVYVKVVCNQGVAVVRNWCSVWN